MWSLSLTADALYPRYQSGLARRAPSATSSGGTNALETCSISSIAHKARGCSTHSTRPIACTSTHSWETGPIWLAPAKSHNDAILNLASFHRLHALVEALKGRGIGRTLEPLEFAVMASNNYNSYHYPYKQSSTQQYPAYQPAPASNAMSQSSRQYPSAPATSQAADYAPYQAPSYSNPGSAYVTTQDSTWTDSGYNGNRETTSRAAEVLRNMSNTAYTSSNAAAASQPGFAATNEATTRYSGNTYRTQPHAHAHTHQPPKSKTPVSAYGQSQVRPRSVDTTRTQGTASCGAASPAITVGYPPQRASTAYNQPPQRSASPTQGQFGHNSQALATPARNIKTNAVSQYNEYGSRQLPNLDATRSTAAATPSFGYGDSHGPAPPQAAPSNAGDTFNQGTTTVDPMAVYDPWPEYQRKQDAIRAQKAVEDAARAEEERKAEVARKKEETTKKEKERQREEEERSRQTSMSKSGEKGRQSQLATASETLSLTSAGRMEDFAGDAMEAEIRALMAKMREFNSKDPAMLARIWEEERRAKAPKSPTAVARPAPAPTPLVQAGTPKATNQRKKVSSARETPAVAAVKPNARVGSPARPAAVAIPPTRTGGNTIWPPEKKATLAAAAATFLNDQNPQVLIQPNQVLDMLDGNPSYIELCEQLEGMGIKLDRAAFAKKLLTAVPDVNASSRAKAAQIPNKNVIASAAVAPPAIMKRDIGTPATPTAVHSPAYARIPDSATTAAPMQAPVAEMVPIKAELKPPANKEEAARKRDFNDLIDLTQADEDDFVPPLKRVTTDSAYSMVPTKYTDVEEGPTANFPVSARTTPQLAVHHATLVPPPQNLRHTDIVEPIDRKKALRRNTYNIKTIARDILLACGRHPEMRQLNQHLDILRTTLPFIQQDADLSTLRWDIIDPGKPPRGYFQDSAQGVEEDADDEEDSDEEKRLQGFSLQSNNGTSHSKVQAPPLVEAINPFKPKKRGRPPRNSFGPDQITSFIPDRPTPKPMSASVPRAESRGVGYGAFRAPTQYDADGKPLPKKRGRPVGWRKSIHGSAQAQASTNANGHTAGLLKSQPSQPSALRVANPGYSEPVRTISCSPSAPIKTRYYTSFKCRWEGCKAELHNLDTLKKHVNKVHRSSTDERGFIECHWADCATQVIDLDTVTGMRTEARNRKSFTTISNWMQHLELLHFNPVSWELGDGPTSGVSGLHIRPSSSTHAEINRVNRYD